MMTSILRVIQFRDQFLENRAFWPHREKIKTILLGTIGFGFGIPFIEQAIPINLPNMAFTLMPLIFVIGLFSTYTFIWRLLRPGMLPFVLAFPLLIYFIAALNSDLPLLSSVWLTFIYGSYYTVLAILLTAYAQYDRDCRTVVSWFTITVSIVAVVAAAIGLYKLVAYRNGTTLDFVTTASSGGYPYGTSLLSDYNLYSLTLLLGAIFLIRGSIRAVSYKHAFVFAFLCTIVIFAGVYSGSRRFIILAPILIAVVVIYLLAQQRDPIKRVNLMGSLFGTVIAVAMLYGLFQGIFYDRHLEVQLATLGNSEFGLSSRLDRWRYALELISNFQSWSINDFGYREQFGCKFVECQHDDYPHSPILSSILYGGLLGLISVIVFHFFQAYLIFKLIGHGEQYFELALALLSAALYGAISGDAVFSVPVVIVLMILASLATTAKQE